jgi:hypothetical protein
MPSRHFRRASVLALLVFVFCFIRTGRGQGGQTFSSGSTGADGALNYSTPGTYYFDPRSFTPPLNPTGDNIFNFTTINIAQGVTLKMSSKVLTGPVYWLASGAVTINGTLDLSGEDGYPITNVVSLRLPAAGGAGGYIGGAGGTLTAGLPLPQPGNGPGAGTAPTTCCPAGGDGAFISSQYLIPLVGGSGGSGGVTIIPGFLGPGGSGGGGAILIASSVSISVPGVITANGGIGGSGGTVTGRGGAGSGGAIRLVAPTITSVQSGGGAGDGKCSVGGLLYGRLTAAGTGGNGRIRLEAFSQDVAAPQCIVPAPLTSIPFNLALPATSPSSLKVVSLVANGITIPINANPFSFPDAIINSSAPVTVNVQAQFIPLGTVPKIIVMSETGPDQAVNCSALQGSNIQQSTCSVLIPFPTGGSRGFVKATWTQ